MSFVSLAPLASGRVGPAQLASADRVAVAPLKASRRAERAGAKGSFFVAAAQEEAQASTSSASPAASRRQFLAAAAAALAAAGLPVQPASASVVTAYQTAEDVYNACSFQYPSGWVRVRGPERYSSAAPLTVKADERITCEVTNFSQGEVATVVLNPTNANESLRVEDFGGPREVAEKVLADRTTMPDGKRTKFIFGQTLELLDASPRTADGYGYVDYKFTAEQSIRPNPRLIEKQVITRRVTLATSTVRDGYWYTLNISCPEGAFPENEPWMRAMIQSFRLTPKTDKFVQPGSDWWHFW
eukprot:tig00022075_g23571.t1